MSAPIDVLAVMDRDCFAAAQNRDDEGMIIPDQRVMMFGESREARAAVAELIEAVEDGIGYGIVFEDDAVRERIRAALARVQGAT